MHIFSVEDYMEVKIEETNNPFDIDIKALFSIGYRQNRKRSFLFVSKLIGKHIAVNPQIPLITSSLMAYYFSQRYDGKSYNGLSALKEAIEDQSKIETAVKYIKENKIKTETPTLIIGFAETATALAHGIFSHFEDNCAFIHTTREALEELNSLVEFEEEHSHAVAHRFFSLFPNIFDKYKRIIMVDDELTTGNTVKNLCNAINHQYGEKDFYILSILDWRKDDALADRGIKSLSLLKGNFIVENIKEPLKENNNLELMEKDIVIDQIFLESDFIVKFKEKNYPNKKSYNFLSGRFGLTKKFDSFISPLCEKYGKQLTGSRKSKTSLCIGYCEFMYIPCMIATNMGEGVKYQSLTQSPIYEINKNYYPVRDKISFNDPWNEEIRRYIYNIIPNEYEEIFILSEEEMPEATKVFIKKELSKRGVIYLHFVSFKGIKTPPQLGSYNYEDVTFLLKDISNEIIELNNETREKIIQNGGHYSEMLPIEYKPKEEYMKVFYDILEQTKHKIAKAVAVVSELLLKEDKDIILVSLARAGTPIGILIKRYIKEKYNLDLPHYSISIIRGKGIDKNAIKFILQNHPTSHIKFIDGWTGKGAIAGVLKEAVGEFYNEYGIKLDEELAVLADPGYCSSLYGTREDFLIPSACLNSTVSGLISRTVLRKDLIGNEDFHGAKYYREWSGIDVSNFYIDTITHEFSMITLDERDIKIDKKVTFDGMKSVQRIKEVFKISDINLIKPGVGETTRVLLRRMPWKVLVKDLEDKNLLHIFLLCKDKNVPIEVYKDMSYSCCGLIMGKGET